jgi:predicted  nucleic acid-binding Zn-ribbon protein
MNRLELAKLRFSSALDALETSVRTGQKASREQTASLAELELLKNERERLYARIAALEAEARELAGLTEEAEGKVDGAIAELRHALGRH